MSGTLGRITGTTIRKSGQTVAGLVVGQLGTPITQATLTSIGWSVYRREQNGSETLTGTGTLTVSAVVFDIPVTTDPRYTLSGGYNFLAVILASAFQVGALLHRVEVTFVPVTGEAFTQTWETTPQ